MMLFVAPVTFPKFVLVGLTFRILPQHRVEQVLHVEAELQRPAAADAEVPDDVRVHQEEPGAAHVVDAERERALLERRRLQARRASRSLSVLNQYFD